MKRIVFLLLVMISLIVSRMADGYSDYESGDYMADRYSGDIAVVCSKSVTIRSEPSYNGRTVKSASNGDILYVHSQYNNWVEVTYTKNGADYDGWVISSYIVIRPMFIMLCSSNIPAYCAPDKASKLVGSLPKQTELTVLGIWDDFYIVNLRNASAFIPMDADLYTSNELYGSIARSARHVVTGRSTKLYSGPGTEWRELTVIPGNAVLVCGDTYDGWIAVSYDGIPGFIDEDDIEFSYSDGNG